VDLDPQGSTTRWLGDGALDDRLLEVFEDETRMGEMVEESSHPGVWLVPASPNLVDVRIAQTVATHQAIGRALEGLDGFDEVVLDCPPALGHVVVAALAAADTALIPVAAHAMELDGLAAVYRTVDAVTRRVNPALRRRVLACRVDRRTRLALEVVSVMRRRLNGEVLQAVVRENVRLAEAPSHGQAITVYAPDSTGAVDYRAVAQELATVEQTHG
jgi:chromosome partitioning protein